MKKCQNRTSFSDLDLTYITDQIIAMSFPCEGRSYYHNNIEEVAKYLDLTHGRECYKVYNLCADLHYDTRHFHRRVVRFPIDDHDVPSLQQILDFCTDADLWLKSNSKNVIVVHCFGGRGRTGTMISSYLVFSNIFKTSKEALNFFAERRIGRSADEIFHGVDTPSQSRYVEYFTKIMTQMSGSIPESKSLRLKNIKISAYLGVGVGKGPDLKCKISVNRYSTFNMNFGKQTKCRTHYDSVANVLAVEPINCPQLSGDIRVKFKCKSKLFPRAYEDSEFYFWFNTSFIARNILRLKRTEFDTWGVYTGNFAIELNFE